MSGQGVGDEKTLYWAIYYITVITVLRCDEDFILLVDLCDFARVVIRREA